MGSTEQIWACKVLQIPIYLVLGSLLHAFCKSSTRIFISYQMNIRCAGCPYLRLIVLGFRNDDDIRAEPAQRSHSSWEFVIPTLGAACVSLMLEVSSLAYLTYGIMWVMSKLVHTRVRLNG